MELRGTLTDFSLEAILGLIHSGHKTGTLRLEATTPLHMQRSIEVSFGGRRGHRRPLRRSSGVGCRSGSGRLRRGLLRIHRGHWPSCP